MSARYGARPASMVKRTAYRAWRQQMRSLNASCMHTTPSDVIRTGFSRI